MDRPSILYVVFVAAAVLVALGERVYARRNETRLLRQGAAAGPPTPRREEHGEPMMAM